MMKPVPDGIKTDPEKLQVEYADISTQKTAMNCPPLKLELKEIIFLFQTTPLLLQCGMELQ